MQHPRILAPVGNSFNKKIASLTARDAIFFSRGCHYCGELLESDLLLWETSNWDVSDSSCLAKAAWTF
jgi:hypothetical protein